ncbi:MAG TPA: hypothetical protein PKU97_00165 [Kofleriaceae bacterium]|nr:hypothetical protein [Kofleriaceae bacterium]
MKAPLACCGLAALLLAQGSTRALAAPEPSGPKAAPRGEAASDGVNDDDSDNDGDGDSDSDGANDDDTYQPDEPPAPGAIDATGELAELRDRVSELEAHLAAAEKPPTAPRPRPTRLTGYADLGFFVPLGNGGAGVVRDAAHAYFPQYADYGWVFYGDLLATAVNSAGEVADLGELPGSDRFDSIDSRGNPSFVVNEVNLSINAGLTPRALLTASVNFTPRQGRDFALGDWLNVDLTQLEWLPTEDGRHSIFLGKMESVLGHEYRARKAEQHFGITPTLLARYTTGTAVGVKVRSKLAGDHLVLAAALTNGSSGTEQFHFHDEIDSNPGKTLSGRVAGRISLGQATLEVAASGQVGAQDGGASGRAYLYGVDVQLTTISLGLRAQWLRGHAPGDPEARAYRLELRDGAYLEASYLINHWLGLLLRGELRRAEVALPPERLYLTDSWRAVAGARVVLAPGLLAKLEVVHNGELGAAPEFRNDIVTSSFVVSY